MVTKETEIEFCLDNYGRKVRAGDHVAFSTGGGKRPANVHAGVVKSIVMTDTKNKKLDACPLVRIVRFRDGDKYTRRVSPEPSPWGKIILLQPLEPELEPES